MTPKQKAEEIVREICLPSINIDGILYQELVKAFESALQEQLYIHERADRRLEQAITEARVEELESVVNQPVGCARTFYIKDRLAALKAGKGGDESKRTN